MIRILFTVVFGAVFALVTAVVVALYWLMILIFGVLRALTLPLDPIWRGRP